jgi:hypothetical protein
MNAFKANVSRHFQENFLGLGFMEEFAEYFQVRSCVKYDDVQSTLNMQLISSQNNIIVPISGK